MSDDKLLQEILKELQQRLDEAIQDVAVIKNECINADSDIKEDIQLQLQIARGIVMGLQQAIQIITSD